MAPAASRRGPPSPAGQAAGHRVAPFARVAPGLLLLLLLLGLPARGGAAPGWAGAVASPAWAAWAASPGSPESPAAPAALHELHETYAELAIEGATVAGRIQFFKKDLERALGPMLDVDAVSLTPGPEADALVLRYLRDRLRVVVGGDPLAPTLLRAEEVRLAHHAGWQLTLSWHATAPVDHLAVRNTLLFELHPDQRNVMRFVRFPEETRETVTTEAGAPEAVVEVGAAG